MLQDPTEHQGPPFETSIGRLPLEHGSDRRETLGKRVSDDLEHFIFRPRRKIFGEK